MIGVNTSIFKSAGRKLVNLLGALKDRATYYENGTDSVAEKNRIDDLGILDKATILLTPTATSDARVHSVKTYTGDELVTNGNFSTSDLSSFGNIYATISIDNERLKVVPHAGQGYGLATVAWASQVGDVFLVKATAYKGNATSTVIKTHTGITIDNITKTDDEWTYEAYGVATSTQSIIRLQVNGADGVYGYFDNVSVTNVSSDFDFDRASSATRINSDGLVQDMQSITDPELVLNGDFEELGDNVLTSTWAPGGGWSVITDGVSCDGSNGNVRQNIEMTDFNGDTFLLTYTLSNVTDSTTLSAKFGGGSNVPVTSTNGTHTAYLTNDATVDNFQFTSGGNWAGDITNISLQQVDPNDRWSLGTGWSIEDGKLVGDGTMTASNVVTQSYDFIDGETYKITFEITESSQGSVFIREPFDASDRATGEVGIHTVYGVAGANNQLRLRSDDTFVGKIDNVSIKHVDFSTDVDLARINYDSNGDNGHILLEPTSTNLLPYSEDFGQWTADDVEVVNNATTSPNGDVTATLIKGNTNTSRHHVAKTTLTNTVTASFSVFAKAKELRYLQVASANSTDQVANFDLSSGTIGTVGAGFSDVVLEEYPNDWYRISLVSLNRYNSFYISLVSSTTASWLESWAMSNNTDGLYIWGAQLEELSYATSYIPTLTGSTVTRATETLTDSGNSTLINSTEGVLYAEIAKVQDNPDHYRLISLNNAASNSDATSVTLGFDNSDDDLYMRIKSGGTVILQEMTQSVTTNAFHKIAIRYKSGDSTFFVNGTKSTSYQYGDETTTFTFPVALDNLSFDYNGNGTLPFYGKCKALAVFNEALEDDELELLTGVTNYGSFGELASANGYTII